MIFDVQASCTLFLAIFCVTIFATTPIAKPGCQTKCGNLTVPYPFGLNEACSLSDKYIIKCYNTSNPPKSLMGPFYEVVDITIKTGQMRVKSFLSANYYYPVQQLYYISIILEDYPYVFSDSENKLTVIGCDDYAFFDGDNFRTGCIVSCSKPEDVVKGACSGIGCCQTSIPKGVKNYVLTSYSFNNHSQVRNFNAQSFAFLVEKDAYNFNGVADLNDSNFGHRIMDHVPMVLEWYVGENETCSQAKGNLLSYACKSNTNCTDFEASSTRGYRCNCLPGYEGNPYLSPGCTDIDECATETSNPCSHICTNIPGSFKCSCPKGQRGDGLKNGTGCISNPSQFVMRLSLGLSLGFLSLLMFLSWICFTMIRRKKNMRMREKYFEQNGGRLLKQQLSKIGGNVESSKIFNADELNVATNNYSEDRILGKGGYGTVYKGILEDGSEVAIKKSRVADQTQVEQFINEVVILTQINHRNVVKLLGCCLETEVPLLVYEFISNRTLFEHIRKNKGITSWLTWANYIRIAAEAADALMYLHSAASTPIIHRDVKSSNILLDERFTTKISDFGASRLVPIDQTQVSTLVQGTLGYLDPEYFRTSQLTEKSDVYSFGVVLAELLTKEKPLCSNRKVEERNLATYFVLAMQEGRLLEIIDPQLVREASEEQLVKMAKLVRECVTVKGEDRPTMKEVALEIEGLRRQNRHPWSEQNNEITNLMDQQDLYLVPSSTTEYSRHYSMEMSLIADMGHPR